MRTHAMYSSMHMMCSYTMYVIVHVCFHITHNVYIYTYDVCATCVYTCSTDGTCVRALYFYKVRVCHSGDTHTSVSSQKELEIHVKLVLFPAAPDPPCSS